MVLTFNKTVLDTINSFICYKTDDLYKNYFDGVMYFIKTFV